MVNVSDVAAMGAKPVATLLSLSLPEECFGKWAEEFMKGYHAASEKYGVKLVGGDTTASVNDIAINVTTIGRAPLAMFLSTTRQLLFLLPLLLILTPEYGAMGAWAAMPIADAASVVVAGTLLFFQMRKLRRMEHERHFSK
jgi:hypothetical protein